MKTAGEPLTLFAVGRLRDLLVDEKVHLQKLSGPVDELKKKLTLMEDLLEDAAVRQDDRNSNIAKLCDQMMDDVDDYVLVVINKKFGIREHLLRLKLLLKIQQLDTMVTDLINSHEGKGGSEQVYLPRSLNEVPPLDEQDFVGREKDIENLVSYLVGGDVNVKERVQIRVVSICGMGGLGKTALAKKVYKQNDVKRHFLKKCLF